MNISKIDSRLLLLATVLCALVYFHISDAKNIGPRLILEQFTRSFRHGRIERAEIFYCDQFTRTTAQAWYDFKFHEKANPGAKNDAEVGCNRKILTFETDEKSTAYIEDSKNRVALLDTLDGVIVFDEGDGRRSPAVAAAYFYQRDGHKVYAFYFSGGKLLNGISSMFFVNNEWLMDQSYYVNVYNSTFGKTMYERYITGQLDIPQKP